jgi:pimeloyl-ACP methyl ester carboxylesterase
VVSILTWNDNIAAPIEAWFITSNPIMTTLHSGGGAVEEYLSLPRGRTFIRWDNVTTHDGPVHDGSSSSGGGLRGPVLLLIHGATVPSWQFDAIVPELVRRTNNDDDASCPKLGRYRVLRMDLYGHGKSHRPDAEYTLDLFVSQVVGVIEHRCVDCTHIIGVGHSMGCAILAKVVASTMERDKALFRGLVFVAPMLDYKCLNPRTRLLSVPVIGEALMRNVIVPRLIDRRRTRYGAIGMPELGDRFDVEIRGTEGHRSSSDYDEGISFSNMLLRMFRHGAVGDQYDAYQGLAEYRSRMSASLDDDGSDNSSTGSLKVHVMWGERDDVANEEQIMRILHRLGGIVRANANEGEIEARLERGGVTYRKHDRLEHNLLLSHPRVCADEIIAFVNRASV